MTPPMARQASFETFYLETAAVIMRQVWTLTRNRAEAQDCVQEAFARAWQQWNTVASHPDPQAWVRRVAYRVAVSRWRKTRNRLLAHWNEAAQRPSAAETNPRLEALLEVMRTLSLAYREVLALHYLADLPVAEVAATLGISENTVKTRLRRAREALATALATDSGDWGAGYGGSGARRTAPDPMNTNRADAATMCAQFFAALRLNNPYSPKEALV